MAVADDRADDYENYAFFANLALRVLTWLETERIAKGRETDDGASLPMLAKILEGSSNGASRVSELDADLGVERSPQEDMDDYRLVRELIPTKSAQELRQWTRQASKMLNEAHDRQWQRIALEDRHWINRDLKPFLQKLTGLQSSDAEGEIDEAEREAVEI
ncbi:MAG TPA: hypothetical protein VHF50_07845 [Solirubrobacterales bacterium]|nr:hypothetical protein [Solirubrobacterales bacterium]